MIDFLRFLLLGLGSGAIYGLIALGLVLVYRGSGVVNFAHGAIALTGAGIYVNTKDWAGTGGGVVIGVASAAVLGALVQLMVMGPLRRASPLARLIATLGLLALGLEIWDRQYTTFPSAEQFLPNDGVEPFGGGLIIGEDRLYLLAIGVVLTALLWWFYRTTRFGIATSAVAENEQVAAAQGWSPRSVATANWALGGGLAGFGGILFFGIAGLSPVTHTLIIIPALAAALVGGFQSFPITFAGGLLIGVLEAEALNYTASETGYFKGTSSAVPFVIVVLILVVRGRALPLRSFAADRLPALGTGRIPLIPVVLFAGVWILTLHIFSNKWIGAVTTSAVFMAIGLSLVVLVGYAGQLSLAQWAVAGLGAMFAGRLAADVWQLPLPAALPIGILFAALVGMIIALPALRVRGVNLAIVTLAMALVIQVMVLTNYKYNGGLFRGTKVPNPSLFGLDINSLQHPVRYGTFAIAMAGLAALAVANLRRGRAGRRLVAVRGNESAAASLGISVLGAKLYAFALSSALAALGGALIAFRFPTLNFNQFDLLGNIDVVLYTVIGGIGFLGGAMVAGTVVLGGALEHILSQFVDVHGWWALLTAAGLVVIVIFHPDGAAANVVNQLGRAYAAISAKRSPSAMPPPVNDVLIQKVPPKTLSLNGVTVKFGTVVALSEADLAVGSGEVVGLIGPNGAGKTTMIEAVTGFVPSTGSIEFDGIDITGLSATERARRGIARSFQSLELFEDMTVLDNLRTAADEQSLSPYLTDLVYPRQADLNASTLAAIDEFGLIDDLGLKPGELPYAKRRTVAIARALATTPSIILLDEPAAGLDSASTAELERLIRRLADEWGMAVLLIEHDVGLVMRTCDRIVALEFGKVIATGTPEEIARSEAVISAYLGADDSDSDPANAPTPGDMGSAK